MTRRGDRRIAAPVDASLTIAGDAVVSGRRSCSWRGPVGSRATLRRCPPIPAVDDVLAGLERLVHLEEVLDLLDQLRREVGEVVHVVPPRLLRRHADDLGVLAGLVVHVQHPDRPGCDPHAGIHRVLEQDERVERVTVAAQGVGDEAVVGRVGRGREQAPVEEHAARLVIDLVLVAAATRDLDHDVDAVVGAGD